MSTYHFITRWQLPATCEEVYRILEEVERLPVWWPSVYLSVRVLEKGRPGGVGKVVDLLTKGWLPYTLRWQFRVTEAEFPHGFALEARGDFLGRGIWTFRPAAGGKCEVVYDWNIRAEKPLLRRLSWLLRPLFAANHRWAMRLGERSLHLELLRRQAPTAEARAAVPPPPGPTWPYRRRAEPGVSLSK